MEYCGITDNQEQKANHLLYGYYWVCPDCWCTNELSSSKCSCSYNLEIKNTDNKKKVVK